MWSYYTILYYIVYLGELVEPALGDEIPVSLIVPVTLDCFVDGFLIGIYEYIIYYNTVCVCLIQQHTFLLKSQLIHKSSNKSKIN